MSEWMLADTIKLLPQWHSTPMLTKPILLALPFRQTAVIGWYFGGLIHEYRMDGSPSEVEPTHWMPLPKLPKHHKRTHKAQP